MEVGGIGHGGRPWQLAGPERNLATEDHLRLPWGSRGAWISLDFRVAPFLEKSFPSYLGFVAASAAPGASLGEVCFWANRQQEEGSRSGKVRQARLGWL